ncbi:hypothetical protein CDD82_4279 [Ophiocordyceps australis]|uniref:Calcineurin-like phosphoesterase domain-containing protein n=1 Tax=Ophiocordyceps australis TaxID=1399860 RepID=A0A2C5Z9G1_9HYPO|nr:hypothetical protein CDD82_4279 [Ophiocordyceps australis]
MGLLVWLRLRRRNYFDSPTLLDHILSSPLVFIALLLYRLILLLRGSAFHPPRDKPPIRVVCISDTHSRPVAVPPGDILIHAGDLTDDGSAAAIQHQLDWLKTLPHGVKIVIAGNHDSFFDIRSRSQDDISSHAALNLDGLTYLEDRLVVPEIKGRRIAIFGAPHIPECGPRSFAFQYTPLTQPWLSKVPPQTDILVTHGPPVALPFLLSRSLVPNSLVKLVVALLC